MEVLYTKYLTELDLIPGLIFLIFFFIGLCSLAVGLGLIATQVAPFIGVILLLVSSSILIFGCIKGSKATNYVDYREIMIKEGYEFNTNFLDQWELSNDHGKIYVIKPRVKKSIKDDEDVNEQ